MPIAYTDTRVSFYQDTVTNNHTAFTPGNSMNVQQFCTLMNIECVVDHASPKDYDKFKFKLLSAYTGLNKVLATQGIYVESSDYSTMFNILGGEEAEAKVSRYRQKARTNAFSAGNLHDGIRTFGSRWESMSPDEQSAASGTSFSR
jgi:hypothetical protein